MRTLRLLPIVFAMSALASLLVHAIPVPILDLDKLTADAPLVILGEVTSIEEAGAGEAPYNGMILKTRIRIAKVRVDYLLKGERSANVFKIRFHSPDSPVGWASLRSHSYGVLFLKPGPSDTVEFSDLYYPFLLSTPGAAPTGDTAIDQVVAAVSRVLESTLSTASERMTAVFILSRSKTAASTAALRAALKDASVEGRLSAAGALLERNDTTGLDIAADALLHGSPDTSLPLYHNLLYGISEGVKDVHVIPVLKTLVDSRDPEIRRATASALMHTQSRDAIGPLLTTLQDSDFDARYYSAVGLAEITGQTEWRPNEDDFRSDQAKYLKHWREWSAGQRN